MRNGLKVLSVQIGRITSVSRRADDIRVMIALMFRLTISCHIWPFIFILMIYRKRTILLSVVLKNTKNSTHYSLCESVLTVST